MKKGKLLTGGSFLTFMVLEYGLAIMTQIIVGTLMYAGLDWKLIFVLLWAGNIILSRSIIFANDKLDVDFTLMGGLKKMTDRLVEKVFIIGIVIKVLITLVVVWWEGAAGFLIFWNTKSKVILILISGLQMLIWTRIYMLAYQVIVK